MFELPIGFSKIMLPTTSQKAQLRPTHSRLYQLIYTCTILLPVVLFYFVLIRFRYQDNVLIAINDSLYDQVRVIRYTTKDLRNVTSLGNKMTESQIAKPTTLLLSVKLLFMALEMFTSFLWTHHVIFPLLFWLIRPMHSFCVFGTGSLVRLLLSLKSIKLKAIQEFYLEHEHEIYLGVWHIPPQQEHYYQLSDSRAMFAEHDFRIVVLYGHGSGGNRSFRGKTYQKILRLGAHVVTFDYRGFADSSPDGVTSDLRVVYQWILDQGVHPKRILVWGHSIGTAIVVRMLSTLPSDITPLGAVLESPFTRIHDMIYKHPISRVFRMLPHFDFCFRDPLLHNSALHFDSLSCLPTVQCPLMILHAEDDFIVPVAQAKRLHSAARKVQPKDVVQRAILFLYSRKLKYGHVGICKDVWLHQRIKKFLELIQ